MRILLHSNAPWVKTGYGQQTGMFAPRLRDLGHDVAVSAFYGLNGTETEWNGIPVFPAGSRPEAYGMDMIPHFYQKFGADIVIILADAWVGAKHIQQLSKLHVANWLPIDAYPLSRRDFGYLIGSGAHPIAMSKFGLRMLEAEKLRPLYVPHGIETSTFVPYSDPTDRDALRAEFGATPDTFIIGMNAANRDLHRKGFFEQFTAFAKFRERNPDSMLYVHTIVDHPNGLDILNLARNCGIEGAVLYPEQGPMAAGEIPPASLVRNFYHLIDLYSGCSLAEGFGVPILEAQSCGVPVVVTDASAMTELCAPSGWLVQGDPLWVEGHSSRWTKPYIESIAVAYEDAYHLWRQDRTTGTQEARQHALRWDATRVLVEHWAPTLTELQERL